MRWLSASKVRFRSKKKKKNKLTCKTSYGTRFVSKVFALDEGCQVVECEGLSVKRKETLWLTILRFQEAPRTKVPPLWEILNDPDELNLLLLFATSNNQQDDILFWCLVARFRVEADPDTRLKMGSYLMSSVRCLLCVCVCFFVVCSVFRLRFFSMLLQMLLG